MEVVRIAPCVRPASSCRTPSSCLRSRSGVRPSVTISQQTRSHVWCSEGSAGREGRQAGAPRLGVEDRAREHRREDDVLGHAEERLDVGAASTGKRSSSRSWSLR